MLLVEHYIHIGDGRVPLSIAQQATDELLLTGKEGEGPALEEPGEPTAAENDAALADLMSKMGGIGG
jgi:hypothetical protein